MTIHDLNMARIEREDDNTKVTPEQLLALALKHLQNGEVGKVKEAKPIAAFLCIIMEEPDGGQTLEGYRCGLKRDQEIGYLEVYKQQEIRRWER